MDKQQNCVSEHPVNMHICQGVCNIIDGSKNIFPINKSKRINTLPEEMKEPIFCKDDDGAEVGSCKHNKLSCVASSVMKKKVKIKCKDPQLSKGMNGRRKKQTSYRYIRTATSCSCQRQNTENIVNNNL